MRYWCERLAGDASNPTSGSRHADSAQRDALDHDISTLERTYFGPASQIEANGTLDSTLRRWVTSATS
jgi:hypothetical protein